MSDTAQNPAPSSNVSPEANQPLKREDFRFFYPESQVAQNPLPERDASRLLVWDGHHVAHRQVKELDQIIPAGSLFIVNDSRVIASRLHGHLATGAKIEILLLEPEIDVAPSKGRWLCLGKPMRKLALGTEVIFKDGLTANVVSIERSSGEGPSPFTVEFNRSAAEALAWLDKHGEMPLPPYIARRSPSRQQQQKDRENYQTVYSDGLGSVAAPTAGLHFSEPLMERLKGHGCDFASVTLHVGAGTFLPVKAADPSSHVMHSERFLVPTKTYKKILSARQSGRKVIVVGTTALRSLEGLARLSLEVGLEREKLLDQWLRTDLFIYPRHRQDRFTPWAADYLMTNFHQPESTLFMLICSLLGFDATHRIYEQAVNAGYRLFSYGDSSLLKLKASTD